MVINVEKTKVMVFGDVSNNVHVMIHKTPELENVTSFKYLGVVLDKTLDFGMHVEYAAGKAKRALSTWP